MVSYFTTIFKAVLEFANGEKYEGNFEQGLRNDKEGVYTL